MTLIPCSRPRRPLILDDLFVQAESKCLRPDLRHFLPNLRPVILVEQPFPPMCYYVLDLCRSNKMVKIICQISSAERIQDTKIQNSVAGPGFPRGRGEMSTHKEGAQPIRSISDFLC